ncbi:FadR/GntR family transcriptional regulator [Kitasatospora sp. NPDC101235]|uniref:FadR/GntR family transcriptional regulator n=1 Tax=Kitasatospora sp. NPDC101235 TaxID=3364101 RepID=UPI0037F7E040
MSNADRALKLSGPVPVRVSSGQRVRVPKTAELVADALRRAIIQGELSPGDALPPESAMMEQFGVSRPTLREAIRVLESESLIVVRRGVHGGARVNAPDPKTAARYLGLILEYRNTNLSEMFDLVSSLEPPCARLLAERQSESDVERLREALAAEREAGTDPVAAAEAHAAFHATLVELTGNRAVITVSETVQCIFAEVGTQHAAGGDGPDFQKDHEAHLKVVRLIAAGKGAEAERHWQRHTALMARTSAASDGDSPLELLA